jgi:hypothetical protein
VDMICNFTLLEDLRIVEYSASGIMETVEELILEGRKSQEEGWREGVIGIVI